MRQIFHITLDNTVFKLNNEFFTTKVQTILLDLADVFPCLKIRRETLLRPGNSGWHVYQINQSKSETIRDWEAFPVF